MKNFNSSNFQNVCIAECQDLLKKNMGIENLNFEQVVGRNELFYKASLNLNKNDIDIYIYSDEAGIMIDGNNWIIFERPDYSNDENLIKSFLEKMSEIVFEKNKKRDKN